MSDREKLIELLAEKQQHGISHLLDNEELADFLLENGVVIQQTGKWEYLCLSAEKRVFRCTTCGTMITAIGDYCKVCGSKNMEIFRRVGGKNDE